MTVEVFFDHTCGFSHRAQHWLDAVAAPEVVWRPLSLLEQNRHDGVAVFDRPDLAGNVSLIALAVHEAVRAADGDLDGYRRRMFSAWHDETGRLSTDLVVEFGREAGLGEFDREAAFAALAAEHAAGAALGVFGTPTFAFGPGQPVAAGTWTLTAATGAVTGRAAGTCAGTDGASRGPAPRKATATAATS